MISKTKNNTAAVTEEGIIVTDLTLKPIGFDQGAASILRSASTEEGAEPGQFLIPEEVVQAVKKYRPIDGTSFKTYFRLGNEGYVCRAYPLAQANGDSSQPLLALHLQRDFSTSETVYQIAAEYDLTDREKEALLGIAMGLTSKEVAERMNISPNTVRAFVRLIMIKMGVTRRAAIISKLLPHGNDLQNGNQDLAEKRADRPPRPTNTYWKRGASSY